MFNRLQSPVSAACALLVCAGLSVAAEQTPAAAPSAEATAATPALTNQASYLLSSERIQGEDKEIFWKGFLTGLRGFEHFYEPIGQPIYFESPLVNSNVRLLYLHHEFASGSQLQGGHVDVLAAQARLAVTERLAIIATKDGHSWLDADILPEDNGWNDIAIGAKYAIWVDRENDFVLTPGVRWQWGNGDKEVLQGLSQEISPFVSFAKGFGKFGLMGNATVRIPTDEDKGNTIFQWDLSASYEIVEGIAPMVELHGLHYWTDAETLPLKVGGLDYANIGSSDVAGSSVIWAGVGARFKLTPNVSAGATFEFALTNRNADIMDNRVTVDVIFTW